MNWLRVDLTRSDSSATSRLRKEDSIGLSLCPNEGELSLLHNLEEFLLLRLIFDFCFLDPPSRVFAEEILKLLAVRRALKQ